MRGGWQPPLPDMPAPPPARAWGRLTPPPGYEPQWRRLVEAALELGLGPDALAETGLEPLAEARNWKPATVALYSKVARYGGVGVTQPRTPEPDPPTLDLRELTRVRSDAPEHLRSVAWCAIALGWPGTVGPFRSLRRRAGLAGDRGAVPVAAPRPRTGHRPPVARLHRRRRVVGPRRADRLAR